MIPNSASACLITYKRPENIGPIVSHLLKQPFIGEVLIRDQEKEENLRCFGRYQLAEEASHEICYVQDDDCIVEDIGLIYEKFLEAPDRIVFGLAPSHWPLWEKGTFTYPETQLAMMGWGAFFNREWIWPAFNRYAQHSEKPNPLIDPFFFREADRIFSLMLGRQHSPVLTPNLRHLPGASEGAAMALESDHYKSRDLAIERCLQILRT